MFSNVLQRPAMLGKILRLVAQILYTYTQSDQEDNFRCSCTSMHVSVLDVVAAKCTIAATLSDLIVHQVSALKHSTAN